MNTQPISETGQGGCGFESHCNKNWYLHFHKTYDPQNWQAGTSRAVDSDETGQVGIGGDVITLYMTTWHYHRDKLKTHLHYHSVYGHQTWQDGNLPL